MRNTESFVGPLNRGYRGLWGDRGDSSVEIDFGELASRNGGYKYRHTISMTINVNRIQ